mmetsp:Transcript_17331/g.34791  ORF Transcript_17331/g.34791 Transcript_17331/m.34791 type:complete len:216 (-) Transcript_17331:452-1099(-)
MADMETLRFWRLAVVSEMVVEMASCPFLISVALSTADSWLSCILFIVSMCLSSTVAKRPSVRARCWSVSRRCSSVFSSSSDCMVRAASVLMRLASRSAFCLPRLSATSAAAVPRALICRPFCSLQCSAVSLSHTANTCTLNCVYMANSGSVRSWVHDSPSEPAKWSLTASSLTTTAAFVCVASSSLSSASGSPRKSHLPPSRAPSTPLIRLPDSR